jgi:hypothetical protein
MGPIDENLDRYIARFAREDDCTADEWLHRAVRSAVMHRCLGEAAYKGSDVILSPDSGFIVWGRGWEQPDALSNEGGNDG